MAVGTNEQQVTWSSSNSTSVSGSSTATSDAVTLSTNAAAATAQMKADHSGIPGSDDYVDFYLLGSCGDPDGSSTDEFEPADETHPTFLGRANMNTSDPAQVIAELPWPLLKAKIYAVNNSGESVTVSATILEQTIT